jgi:hypothetical protein
MHTYYDETVMGYWKELPIDSGLTLRLSDSTTQLQLSATHRRVLQARVMQAAFEQLSG